MPRRQHKAAAEKEARIQQALEGIKNGAYRSAYHAAKELRLSTSTISDRLRGGYRVPNLALSNKTYHQQKKEH